MKFVLVMIFLVIFDYKITQKKRRHQLSKKKITEKYNLHKITSFFWVLQDTIEYF